jgi:lipid-binding SYLF domain-containing protein
MLVQYSPSLTSADVPFANPSQGRFTMNIKTFPLATAVALLLLGAGAAHAASYEQTIQTFKNARQSAGFFKNSYGYAVFPTVGEGSFIVGAAHGDGRVYKHGVLVGNTAVTQLSIGWQAGGEGYSEIIFFKDQRALDAFESGNFQFGAGVSVVAITASASASADTTGTQASASGGKNDAVVDGAYSNGMVVFTIVKGGLQGGASVEGEKFSFSAKS